MIAEWMLEKAYKEDTNTLRNWIWSAISQGQPIPGCMSVEALRRVLRERGEDGSGYHNTRSINAPETISGGTPCASNTAKT